MESFGAASYVPHCEVIIIMTADTPKPPRFQCYQCGKHFDSHEEWKAHQLAEHEPTLTFRLLELPSNFSGVKEGRN